MWTPTHAQVTVHRARNLIPKGKGGTNDAYVTIQLGKDKYQTSVKERTENPEWHEECDMSIPDKAAGKDIQLSVFHRSFLGLDDFLGHVSLPLEQFQIYERPRSRWYALKARPGKKGDTKYRGEIECKVTFVVQSKSKTGSTEDLKRAGSIKNLANSVSEKFKLPLRSSSFKDKEENLKKKKAFVEPLVRSPSDAEASRVEPEPLAPDSGTDRKPPPSPEKTRIGTIQEHPTIVDPKITPLQAQNKQLSFSEADLNKRWQKSDVSRRINADETDGLIRYRQPIYKESVVAERSSVTKGPAPPPPPPETSQAPLLKRTSSDAEAKFVQQSQPDSAQDEVSQPLEDTRELTKSLSKLNEDTDSIFTTQELLSDLRNRQMNGLADRSRSSISGSIPESIPEESMSSSTDDMLNLSADEVKLRQNNDRFSKKPNSRRHTLQFGGEDLHTVPAHDLQEVRDYQRQKMSISPELLEEYRGITREELIRLVHTQKNALYTKDMYIRDLENYIDNLLVRVMENTPRILQNPFRHTDVTLLMTPASNSVRPSSASKSGSFFKKRK